MAISPIHFGTSPVVPSIAPTAQTPARSSNREVAAAVQTLNDAGSAGSGRQFSIAIDSKTKVAVVRIVDSNTHELIAQIPSQYILDLAHEISQETASNSAANSR